MGEGGHNGCSGSLKCDGLTTKVNVSQVYGGPVELQWPGVLLERKGVTLRPPVTPGGESGGNGGGGDH